MDMYEAAAVESAVLYDRYEAASAAVMQARYNRGVLAAGVAVASLRALVPAARVVYFDGPSEPNDTASIVLIQDHDAGALYSVESEIGLDELEDQLVEAQDFLTGALEDGVRFQHAMPSDYVLYL